MSLRRFRNNGNDSTGLSLFNSMDISGQQLQQLQQQPTNSRLSSLSSGFRKMRRPLSIIATSSSSNLRNLLDGNKSDTRFDSSTTLNSDTDKDYVKSDKVKIHRKDSKNSSNKEKEKEKNKNKNKDKDNDRDSYLSPVSSMSSSLINSQQQTPRVRRRTSGNDWKRLSVASLFSRQESPTSGQIGGSVLYDSNGLSSSKVGCDSPPSANVNTNANTNAIAARKRSSSYRHSIAITQLTPPSTSPELGPVIPKRCSSRNFSTESLSTGVDMPKRSMTPPNENENYLDGIDLSIAELITTSSSVSTSANTSVALDLRTGVTGATNNSVDLGYSVDSLDPPDESKDTSISSIVAPGYNPRNMRHRRASTKSFVSVGGSSFMSSNRQSYNQGYGQGYSPGYSQTEGAQSQSQSQNNLASPHLNSASAAQKPASCAYSQRGIYISSDGLASPASQMTFSSLSSGDSDTCASTSWSEDFNPFVDFMDEDDEDENSLGGRTQWSRLSLQGPREVKLSSTLKNMRSLGHMVYRTQMSIDFERF